MANDNSLSPLIIKYETILGRDPRSRVFAPLAESYRKIGLIDKALGILKQGVRYNPEYVMGYLGLAACYVDEGQDQLAYSTLRPIVEANRDNLKLQRLFAEVCMKLELHAEALDTYKYLLFINPRDQSSAERVKELELKAEEVFTYHSGSEAEPIKFDLSHLDSDPLSHGDRLEEWVRVDLSGSEELGESEEEWSVEELESTPPLSHNELKADELLSSEEPTQEVSSFREEEYFENRGKNFDPAPVITHTLVDLYIQQGHLVKAKAVLEKILEINEGSQETVKKLQEIELLLNEEQALTFPEKEEERGRQNLMGLFEKATSEELEPDKSRLESLLWSFNNAIQKRAQEGKD